jgi:hypothetical protein
MSVITGQDTHELSNDFAFVFLVAEHLQIAEDRGEARRKVLHNLAIL